MGDIEREYRQPPGWWGTLTREQQTRILALRSLEAETNAAQQRASQRTVAIGRG